MSSLLRRSGAIVATAAFTFLFTVNLSAAPHYSEQTFATGTPLGTTQPDSTYFGLGSVWISYQNGSDSTGLSGSSTVVRYNPSGVMQQAWSIKGNVDGLRIDPHGLVWALQNDDANSMLTAINPVTNTTTLYTYGDTYTNVTSRGFDDVVFTHGNTFLSETNPASNSDPIVLRLTTGLSSPPLQVAGILNQQFTGTNLANRTIMSDTITDSDSLILAPNGDLVLTGEADQQLVFIHKAGAPNQSESFINLVGASGFLDDSAFNGNATQGYLLMGDNEGNKVYKITAPDFHRI